MKKLNLFAALLFTTFMSLNAQSAMPKQNRNVILSQGFPVKPMTPWFPQLKSELEKLGIPAVAPQMSETPSLESWQSTLKPLADVSPKNTILVGHSIGSVNILRYLETSTSKEKYPLLVLVAPPAFSLGYEALSSFFATPFEFEKIKSKVEKMVVIITLQDGVLGDPMKHADIYLKNLDAKVIILPKGGHFAPFEPNGGVSLMEVVEEIKLVWGK
jgi:uncharacterized protein